MLASILVLSELLKLLFAEGEERRRRSRFCRLESKGMKKRRRRVLKKTRSNREENMRLLNLNLKVALIASVEISMICLAFSGNCNLLLSLGKGNDNFRKGVDLNFQ